MTRETLRSAMSEIKIKPVQCQSEVADRINRALCEGGWPERWLELRVSNPQGIIAEGIWTKNQAKKLADMAKKNFLFLPQEEYLRVDESKNSYFISFKVNPEIIPALVKKRVLIPEDTLDKYRLILNKSTDWSYRVSTITIPNSQQKTFKLEAIRLFNIDRGPVLDCHPHLYLRRYSSSDPH